MGSEPWLFGSGDSQHIGASGVLFGFFGYLVFRTTFDRRISSAVITLIVAAEYGTAIAYALVPADTTSWSGHFFGFTGGFLAARFRYPTSRISAHTRDVVGRLEIVPRGRK